MKCSVCHGPFDPDGRPCAARRDVCSSYCQNVIDQRNQARRDAERRRAEEKNRLMVEEAERDLAAVRKESAEYKSIVQRLRGLKRKNRSDGRPPEDRVEELARRVERGEALWEGERHESGLGLPGLSTSHVGLRTPGDDS